MIQSVTYWQNITMFGERTEGAASKQMNIDLAPLCRSSSHWGPLLSGGTVGFLNYSQTVA